jgi:hypothetical protein
LSPRKLKTVAESDFVNFEGTSYDWPDPGTYRSPDLAMVQDGARSTHPDGERYRRWTRRVKRCLDCPHWVFLHPDHGPCIGINCFTGPKKGPCKCTGFADPIPGRPDLVYTRDQIDRMSRWRWDSRKDRIFLLKDGYYGLWDKWSDPSWLAPPGMVSKPWLDPNPEPPLPPKKVWYPRKKPRSARRAS